MGGAPHKFSKELGGCSLEYFRIYRSLTKERPWEEHLASLPKRGVGTFSCVSAFNHAMYIHVGLQ